MILLLGAFLLGACGGGEDGGVRAGGQPRPSYPLTGPPQIFLITLDTLRADFTTPYGSGFDTTPFLEELARESVVYTRAYAPMPTTDPSHLTMLTGLYPQQHGVMNNGVMPFTGLLDIAELMKRQSRRTAAFTSVAHLNPQGLRIDAFDAWDWPKDDHERDAAETVDRALRHLEQLQDEPFFFWLHLFDPHQPYQSHEDSSPGLLDQLASLSEVPPLEDYGFYPGLEIPDRQVALMKTLYRADISHMDVQLRRFYETLESYGFDETALILVAADHGEILDEMLREEQYGFNHGKALGHAELRIPLMVRPPGGREPARVSTVVENRAVFGTLVEAAGLHEAVGDLVRLPVAEQPPDPNATAFAVRRTFLSEPSEPMLQGTRFAAIQDNWMLRRVDKDGATVLELFDLAADPRGTRNVAPAHPEVVQRLDERMTAWLEEMATAGRDETVEEVDEASRKSLESLGYLR